MAITIRRTTIPYTGRSNYETGAGRRTRRRSTTTYSSTGGGGGGGLIAPGVTPTGTATCTLDVTSSYIYDTDLPATITMNVLGQVNNQSVPTYVQTENITGGSQLMTITVTDNGTDHAVLSVALPANFSATGKLTIPVLVNCSTGADIIQVGTDQTMEQAFESRTKTTKAMECYWEYSVLHQGADGTVTRGPILWKSSIARRFSNGQGPEAQDSMYMDLIMRTGDRNVYKCITSYTQTAGQTWSEVSSNWQVDNNFAVTATGLILEENGRITLNPDNEIIAYNSGGSHTVTINGNGVDAQLGLFGHASMGDAEIYAISILDDDNDDVVGTVNAHGYSTIGTVSAHDIQSTMLVSNTIDAQNITAAGTITSNALISTAVTASSMEATTIDAIGTVTAGPVISSSIRTGDITSVGTVSAARINGTTLQAGSVSLVDNNTQYAAIDTTGLSIGTVTTQSATTRALTVVNGVGGTVATISITGEINTLGTVISSSVRTHGINVLNSGNIPVASISGNGVIQSATSVSAPTLNATTLETTDIRRVDGEHPESFRTVAWQPFDMDTAFITDSGEEYFLQDGEEGTWTFLGVDTHVSYEIYPFITVSGMDDEGLEDGQYWFTEEEGSIMESSIPSGIFVSSHTVANNRMYYNLDDGTRTMFGLSF